MPFDRLSIIIPIGPSEKSHEKLVEDLRALNCEIIISSETSRAQSLNAGAAKATGDFFWFLHADSRISNKALQDLEQALASKPNFLHYFDLEYEGGGLPALNSYGANIRSRLLGLPYGDQGFCLSKPLFNQIGGYPENVLYGEDLHFVRKAKRLAIKLNRISSRLSTSARKYHNQGWLKVTLVHQWQFIKLMMGKL